jgi:PAS domain S-box-containing protein
MIDAGTGVVVDANPALLGMVGYRRDALVGQVLWDLPSFEHIPASRAVLTDLARRDTMKYDDWALKSADGGDVDVDVIGLRYEADHQSVIQFNIRNTTDRSRPRRASAILRCMMRSPACPTAACWPTGSTAPWPRLGVTARRWR